MIRHIPRSVRPLLSLLAVGAALVGSPALAQDNSHVCPAGLESRTPDEVLVAHVAAVQSEDIQRILCDYDDNAIVLLPHQTSAGLSQIAQLFGGLFQLTGPSFSLNLVSKTNIGDYLLLEWTLQSSRIIVGDLTETFVIRHGKIVLQTAKLADISAP